MLSNTEINTFIKKGFIKIENAFTGDFVEKWWGPREKFLKNNANYSNVSHLYFPVFRRFNLKEIAPKLDTAIIQLLGGENRIKKDRCWGDGFVVAQPRNSCPDIKNDPSYSFHKDGFFRHYLDSPEIGLLTLVLWTKVYKENGATAIFNDSIRVVSKELYSNLEGVNSGHFDNRFISDWKDQSFAEGNAGDIYLLHPFVLHAIRPNMSKQLRAITNPCVSLLSKMNFNRENWEDYSPVEKSVLLSMNLKKLNYSPIEVPNNSPPPTAINLEINNIRDKLRKDIEATQSSV